MILDNNLTFSYDPSNNTKNLVAFEEENAELILNNATIHTTLPGIQFTKGKITIKGMCYFVSETQKFEVDERIVLTDESITFGDSTLPTNDCIVKISVGSTLKVTQGSIRYKNIGSATWQMENNSSTLHLVTGTRLLLHQNLLLNAGGIVFDDKAILGKVDNKQLQSVIMPQGFLIKERIIE